MGRRKPQSYLSGAVSHRHTEGDYMGALLDVVSLDDWRDIVAVAVSAARAGDAGARAWLAQYLVGKPTVTAPTPLTVVVQQLAGRDPVVDALAKPHIDRIECPFRHQNDDIEDALRADVAAQLRTLQAQNAAVSPADDSADESIPSSRSQQS